MSTSALLATVRQKYEALAPLLHEKAQRRWAACEARALGRGGISLVAAATGLSRPTSHRGLAELRSGRERCERIGVLARLHRSVPLTDNRRLPIHPVQGERPRPSGNPANGD